MVTGIQLPPEPEGYVGALMREGWFTSLATSDEDRRRGELYRQRDEAEALRGAGGNIEDFYRDLEMALELASVNEASLARAAQLTQKTNQFNITTRRYSDADLERRSADPEWVVRTARVRDRFGDNGIVGLLMARANGAALEVDTFLLSCRVIGRTVETAMLASLCDEARQRGLHSLTGVIVPTNKNAPVRDLFERHGFEKVGTDPDGTSHWSRALAKGAIAWPPWFLVTPLTELATAAGDD
jgi:FkbH-like protein